MFIHRIWGLVLFALYAVLALLSVRQRREASYAAPLFAAATLLGLPALSETGLREGNRLFEPGLGVAEPMERASPEHERPHE